MSAIPHTLADPLVSDLAGSPGGKHFDDYPFRSALEAL